MTVRVISVPGQAVGSGPFGVIEYVTVVGNVAECSSTWAMEVPLPFTLVPPAGASIHVTAGALATVQVKSDDAIVD
jgi:hypothetical protein